MNGKVLVTDYINEPGEAKILIEVAKQLVEGTFEKGSRVLFDTQVIDKENAPRIFEMLEQYK
ncbi:MAG: hypothetical protein U5N58_01665 [Actinomycetota bacterium]|nr:hypothetical protein [Actinomycetota bacterium]